jgi:hypothetical protein
MITTRQNNIKNLGLEHLHIYRNIYNHYISWHVFWLLSDAMIDFWGVEVHAISEKQTDGKYRPEKIMRLFVSQKYICDVVFSVHSFISCCVCHDMCTSE